MDISDISRQYGLDAAQTEAAVAAWQHARVWIRL